MAVRLVERVNGAFAGSRVDKAAGVVRGVLLCGARSENGRDYPAALWPKSIAKYEGVPIHSDHARERRIGDRIGWITNARVVDGRPRGDANFLTSHPLVPPVLEAAERNPGLFGFSHVCMADTKRINGRETVEGIGSVEALDLVASPATTSSLFESLMYGLTPAPTRRTDVTTLRKVIETKLTGANRRRFVEAVDAPTLDVPVDEPAFDASADEAVKAAIESAGGAIWSSFIQGRTDLDAALGKLRKLARAFKGVSDSGPAEESRGGVRWDAGAGRLIHEDGRTLAEAVTGRPSRAEAAAFVESVTGRRPKPSATWDGQRIRFTD